MANECNCLYVGETTRIFGKRFKEHTAAVRNSAASNRMSAISQHARESGHAFELSRFLDKSNHFHELLLKEALYIVFNADKLCNIRSTEVNSLVSHQWHSLAKYFRI